MVCVHYPFDLAKEHEFSLGGRQAEFVGRDSVTRLTQDARHHPECIALHGPAVFRPWEVAPGATISLPGSPPF